MSAALGARASDGLASTPIDSPSPEAVEAAAGRFDGEYLRWEVRYLGVVGGYAEAWTELGEDGALVTTALARNAPWYAKIYSIDDRVVSTWDPGGGSRHYSTWFREGKFQQDQDMVLDADPVTVWRKQNFKEGWREWSTPYEAVPLAQDPVSAFFQLRMLNLDETRRFPIFSGSETWTLEVVPMGREHLEGTSLGSVDTRRVQLRTSHRGDVEQKGTFTVWVTDDARRLPVRMVVKTNFGPIKADLVAWEAPVAVAEGGEGDEPG
jgi:hypothetical protein